MIEVISIIVAVGFFLNGLLHLLLVFGFPLGEFVFGGKHVIFPLKIRIISIAFVIIWTFIGVVYLNYGHVIQLDIIEAFDRKIIILSTIFLFFAFFSNAFLTKSKKERYVMIPFALLTFILSFILLCM